MGKTITFKYAMRVTCRNHRGFEEINQFPWKVAEYGRPTPENIARWLEGFRVSLEAGGCNEHLAASMRPYSRGYIYEQSTGKQVAQYDIPVFQVIA